MARPQTKADLQAEIARLEVEAKGRWATIDALRQHVAEIERQNADHRKEIGKFQDVERAVAAVMMLRGRSLAQESEAVQLELPCGMCREGEGHDHDAVGRCTRHGKRVKGLLPLTQEAAEKEALTEIMSACAEVCDTIDQYYGGTDLLDENNELHSEREKMLRALGMTEREWALGSSK